MKVEPTKIAIELPVEILSQAFPSGDRWRAKFRGMIGWGDTKAQAIEALGKEILNWLKILPIDDKDIEKVIQTAMNGLKTPAGLVPNDYGCPVVPNDQANPSMVSETNWQMDPAVVGCERRARMAATHPSNYRGPDVATVMGIPPKFLCRDRAGNCYDARILWDTPLSEIPTDELMRCAGYLLEISGHRPDEVLMMQLRFEEIANELSKRGTIESTNPISSVATKTEWRCIHRIGDTFLDKDGLKIQFSRDRVCGWCRESNALLGSGKTIPIVRDCSGDNDIGYAGSFRICMSEDGEIMEALCKFFDPDQSLPKDILLAPAITLTPGKENEVISFIIARPLPKLA
jgi:hypothetical protein